MASRGSDASISLASLFPEFVSVVAWDGGVEVPPVHPDEEVATLNAVPARRAEFARGRACAGAALRKLGVEVGPIPVGPARAPVWPPGVVGSITHCAGLVAAAVARTEDARGIGLDAEAGGELPPHLVGSVCTVLEVEALRAATRGRPGPWHKLLFSAKESVHKAIHPVTGVWLDFLDVEVTLDLELGRFTVRRAGGSAYDVPELPQLLGRFLLAATHVVTGVILPPGPSKEERRGLA